MSTEKPAVCVNACLSRSSLFACLSASGVRAFFVWHEMGVFDCCPLIEGGIAPDISVFVSESRCASSLVLRGFQSCCVIKSQATEHPGKVYKQPPFAAEKEQMPEPTGMEVRRQRYHLKCVIESSRGARAL
jgi:hypothetical protein